jgi:hypothetical protein
LESARLLQRVLNNRLVQPVLLDGHVAGFITRYMPPMWSSVRLSRSNSPQMVCSSTALAG